MMLIAFNFIIIWATSCTVTLSSDLLTLSFMGLRKLSSYSYPYPYNNRVL